VGWQAVAAGWERRRELTWDASRGVSERMVELLDPEPGQTVLEIAAGLGDTGFLAAERLGPSGRLVSSDFVPEMVAAAERRALELGLTNVDFRTLDAQALDLADDSVDGVLCRWGYMLVPDPAEAFMETRRVLRPGGHVAFAVWGTADENPWAAAIGRVLVSTGRVERPEPDSPGPFRLADPEHVRRLVEGAGLDLRAEEDIPLTWSYSGFDEYWEVSRDLSRTLATALEAMSAVEALEVSDGVRDAVVPYRDGDGLALPGLCRVALARRPR
jgi:SAM-dependent methyltransferase